MALRYIFCILTLALATPASAEESMPTETDPCAAVAFTADGHWGAAFGKTTCHDAKNIAMEQCKKNAVGYERKCEDTTKTYVNRWIMIQHCQKPPTEGTYVSVGVTPSQLITGMHEHLKRNGMGGPNCKVLALFHSDGRHNK
jgi:hypothetical protein